MHIRASMRPRQVAAESAPSPSAHNGDPGASTRPWHGVVRDDDGITKVTSRKSRRIPRTFWRSHLLHTIHTRLFNEAPTQHCWGPYRQPLQIRQARQASMRLPHPQQINHRGSTAFPCRSRSFNEAAARCHGAPQGRGGQSAILMVRLLKNGLPA